MPIAYWRDEYCTGNAEIDEQHQKLFKIINNLHDAMLQGHGKEVLKNTLDELIFYTIDHFIAFLVLARYT
jgi:hemerythrin